MKREIYASILLEHVYAVAPDDKDRVSLITATFNGILESIVNQADYTPAQKVAKIRNLNDARKEVIADE